jgi:tight adherence protein B
MTLWLAAAAVGALVLVVRPRPARRRLAGRQPAHVRRGTTGPSIGAVDLCVAAVVGSALVAAGLPLVIAVGGGVLPVGWTAFRSARGRSRDRHARQAAVAELTFALAGELRAGRTASEALRASAVTAGPLAHAMLAAAEAVAVGASAAAELDAASELPGAERLRSVAAAWRVTESAGGRIALVLERLGEAMDRDDELQREMDAALAAPKATMTLLAGLPLLGLVLGQAIGAHPLHLLLYRPLGWLLLVGAAVLDAVGIAVSRQITKVALRC